MIKAEVSPFFPSFFIASRDEGWFQNVPNAVPFSVDPKAFGHVLLAIALQVLPDGDQTAIGDRGINLSGVLTDFEVFCNNIFLFLFSSG